MPIGREISALNPVRVVDLFGGSATVSVLADRLGIPSIYSDASLWASTCARTLLCHRYSKNDLMRALRESQAAINEAAPGFISEEFDGCYFTRRENAELDSLHRLVGGQSSSKMRDLLFYGVANSCLAKLPMAMFHRACLRQRLAKVERRNGNSTIWNTPLAALIPRFIQEAVLFTWSRRCRHVVIRMPAVRAVSMVAPGDAVFLDPPYASGSKFGPSYSEAYHFLEGFVSDENRWREHLNKGRNHPLFDPPGTDRQFESAEGWVEGMSDILGRCTKSGVIATARALDRPGAADVRRLLRQHFDRVRWNVVSECTIFSERSNPQLLFTAS